MPGEHIDIDGWPGKDEGVYLFCFGRPHALPSPNPRGLDDRHPVSKWVAEDGGGQDEGSVLDWSSCVPP